MESSPAPPHNRAMNHEAMFEQAVQLAYETFDDPTDDHITGVYAQLVWGLTHGVQIDSVTVH